ncbi:hypothetical protein V6N13_094923 [Hibiscus sabdariffa]
MDMDPVSSSSSTTTLRPNSPHQRFKPTQPVVERIVRALCHPLFLLHRPCRLSRLLGTPTSPEALAGASLRERFHQLFSEGKKHGGRSEGVKEIDEGTVCPICLEEMEKKDKVAACSTCQNPIHEECLTRRKSSRERRSANCVICRARWRSDQGKYLNLAAYIGRDDAEGGGGSGLCAE